MDRKVALITGAQRGIGRAIAIAAAQNGFAVAINHFEEAMEAEALRQEIVASGGEAMTVSADVSKVDQMEPMVATVEAAFGCIDVLVNNAGIFPRRWLLEMTEDVWDAVIDVNLKGTCFASIAAAKSMIRGARGGSIINLASSAINGGPRSTAYAASKGGIVALTRGMAVELAPHRIRVNAIAPGITNTLQPRGGMSEEMVHQKASEVLIGRMAEPVDIANMAVFLMTDKSGMVTGQTLHINGGDYRP